MSALTRKRWTKNEDEILSSSLVNGIELHVLEVKLPERSQHAIIRRCLNLGFSTHAENGVKVLYYGIKRRNRVVKKKNEKVKVDEFPSVRADEASTSLRESFTKKHIEMIPYSALTKANVGLEINSQVISILQDYNLQTDSKTIFELSEFIAKNQMKDIS